jgi:serine/threonine protein kinase/Ca2+-binding EF-hand superfamily protein
MEMEKFVHTVQKQLQKSNAQGPKYEEANEMPLFLQRIFKYKAWDREEEYTQPQHSELNQNNTAPIPQSNGTSTATSPSEGYVSMFNAPSRAKSAKDINLQLRNKITIALLPTLTKEMYGPKNRKHFIEWLFKISDIHKANSISEAELAIILRAVQRDGFNLSSLLFDEPEEDDNIVKKIMEEYNVSKTGSLSKEEFLNLANVIFNLYEGRFQLGDDNDDLYGNIVCGHYRLLYTLGKGSYGIVKYAEKVMDDSEMSEKGRYSAPNTPRASTDRQQINNNAKLGTKNTISDEKVDVEEEEDDFRRAIKVIKKGNVSELSQLDVEIQAMQMLRHPAVVRLYNVDSDERYIYLEMELCGGGSLYDHLQSEPFPEPLARYYFYQLIKGLQYCHSMGVCHRDLRLENLLMDNYGNMKITDFGQARIFKKGWDLFSTQLVGSLYHLSPEQIEGKVYSGEKVDIWGAGIILYCFLTSRLPFNQSDIKQMFDDIRACNYSYEDSDNISEEARDLISKMLCAKAKNRITLEQILEHPWMHGEKKKAQLMIENFEYASWFKRFKVPEAGVRTLTTILCENLISFGCHYKLCAAKTEHEALMKEIIDEMNDLEQDPNSIYGERPSQDKFDTLELPRVTPISTKPLIVVKCISTTRNMKFAIFAEKTLNDSLFIVFHLREGETKEFKELLHKLKKELRSRLSTV